MKSKEKNVLVIVVLTALFFMAFDCFTGKAGSLEPNAPPQPTMATLGQISAQIEAMSSPVEKVVRGVITFPYPGNTEQSQGFSPAVDPNRCVVMFSDAVAFNRESNPVYEEWLARTGVCLIGLTETQIIVEVEGHRADQKVSYQIIEYK